MSPERMTCARPGRSYPLYMSEKKAFFAVLAIVPVVFACSSEGGGGGSPDGSAPADGGVVSEGGTLPDGAANDCVGLPEKALLAELPVGPGLGMGLTSDAIVVGSPTSGADTGYSFFPKTGALLRIPKAGGAPVAFHTPAPTVGLGAWRVVGNDVYFFEFAYAEASKAGKLYRRGLNDAAATPIGTGTFDGVVSYVAGADAASVYVVTPGKDGEFDIVRVDKASGASTVMTSLPSLQFGQAQLFGGFVYFYATQGAGALYRVPVDATGVAPTKVTDRTCFGGGLTITSDAFYCGEALALSKYDLAFANPLKLVNALDYPNAQAPWALGVFGTEVLVAFRAQKQPMLALPVGGGPARKVACEIPGPVEAGAIEGDNAFFMVSPFVSGGRQNSLYRLKITR